MNSLSLRWYPLNRARAVGSNFETIWYTFGSWKGINYVACSVKKHSLKQFFELGKSAKHPPRDAKLQTLWLANVTGNSPNQRNGHQRIGKCWSSCGIWQPCLMTRWPWATLRGWARSLTHCRTSNPVLLWHSDFYAWLVLAMWSTQCQKQVQSTVIWGLFIPPIRLCFLRWFISGFTTLGCLCMDLPCGFVWK